MAKASKEKRISLKKEINEINVQIVDIKLNRKEDKIDEFMKINKYPSFGSVFSKLAFLRRKVRYLHVISGILNGKEYKNIEQNPREPLTDTFIEKLVKPYLEVEETVNG